MPDQASDRRPVHGPPRRESAQKAGLTRGQLTALIVGLAVIVAVALTFPARVWTGLVYFTWAVFLIIATWRLLVILTPRGAAPVARLDVLPRYTVVAALYDEAAMLPQLVERLSRLDYPSTRLQGLIVLEADDQATLSAARSLPLPTWMAILVVPADTPGPRTKPRALNHALNHVTGDLITVYDAEDDPHPAQLREAAARFQRPGHDIACFQAPLRIRVAPGRNGFLERQFAAEYASLFEVTLPAMARLGLPFPLGGTSNHFRADILRQVGGWDPWNVTEDADLGYRLWKRGWRLGVLTRATWESPPTDLDQWLPQRTRWLKGYMQTWGVHMRAPWRLGLRGFWSLQITTGVAILSAAVHALTAAWMIMLGMTAATKGLSPATPPIAVLVLAAGVLAAWLTCWLGLRRAGGRYRLIDAVSAPTYWSLTTVAFFQAAWRLVTQPYAWDKTPHEPDEATVPASGREAA
ncbi:glycosyltransferase [Brevundimonas sp.]|uniref:glycosyltransferase n=1 Tax=Brevundimonas sp. TaxID=1871086 RepID=UPI0035AE8892